MKTKQDGCTLRFAAEVLSKHLMAIQQEVEGIRLSEDVEPVHRMRVAARRFRSTLPLFENNFKGAQVQEWKQHTRKLGRVLGTARDTDVKIERVKEILKQLPDASFRIGIHRLLIRLKQDRAAQQEKVLKTLDKMGENHLLSEMLDQIKATAARAGDETTFSAELYQTAYHAIDAYLTELLGYDAIVDHPEMKTELHAMRVAAKRLRYALEAFAPLYPQDLNAYIKYVRQVQDQLGNIHDNDVWELFLADYRVAENQRTLEYYGYSWPINRHWPGIDYLARLFADERKSIYEDFHQEWRTLMLDSWWSDLRLIVLRPLSMTQSIFPPSRGAEVFQVEKMAPTDEVGT
jgi:CHAD domain-containing protein